jgi:hypothetical protein
MPTFRLEQLDGRLANPPTFRTSVPNWAAGHRIPLGRGRALRVVDVRPGATPDDDLVLVVETEPDMS